MEQQGIRERCQAVFATLDLAQDLCRQIVSDELPREVRERLIRELSADRR